jgi:tetratricopeptide (TPR) repeat protein
MNLAKVAILLFSGWFMVMGASFAQEAGGSGSVVGEAYEKTLRDADSLIKSGKPAEAYALLEPLEFEHAGEERFDYLLGAAALDSGKPDKATLALERVLMVNPNSAGARLDIARAYYQLGDMLRAKAEFETVLKQNPAPAARTTIDHYLQAIASQEPGSKTHLSGYVEGALGRDSNANNATAQSQVNVNIPGVGPFVASLNPTSLKTADNYYGIAAGGEAIFSLNPNWGLYAGADLRQRTYHTQKSFDTLGAEMHAGALYGAEANRVRLGVLGGQYTLGPTRNRNTAGFNADWARALSPSNQVNLFGQYLQYRFADIAMQINDFNQQVVGVGWVHVLADGKSMLNGSLYAGTEQEVSNVITLATPSGGRTDGAKRFSGLRIGGQAAWSDRTVFFANAGWQTGNYSKSNPFFLVQRADKFQDLALGALWHWDTLWTVRPQLSYARNNSNIAIYGYTRADASVTLRRDFK